ncbi:MAG: hypothetical protein IME96_00960 [Proteobacteria bacterium]|nr:hypothetical protein [Pseudomonadota bacterium]
MAEQYLSLSLFIAFLLHFPFGFYGARFVKFSRPWGRCLYIPILITIILRRYLGIGYEFIPYFILVALTGQVVGKWLGRRQLSVVAESR